MVKKELPKLPHGEGTMSYMPDGDKIIYKKTINGKRLSVYGTSPKECMTKMREKEKEIDQRVSSQLNGTMLLGDAVKYWHTTFKAPNVVLKPKSFDREQQTIKNMIEEYPIGKTQLQAIDALEVQKYLNQLIQDEYSYATIKKAYQLLNQYFKYYYAKAPYNNPMYQVKMPSESAMLVQTKETEFFDEEDIKSLEEACNVEIYKGNYVGRTGAQVMFLMYTGLRVGEATALKWENVDMENKTITIKENRQKIIDRKHGLNDDGTFRHIYTETTPKTKQSIRTIPMTEKAFFYAQKLKNYNEYHDYRYVFVTKDGNPVSDRNLRKSFNVIQKRAETKVQNSGLHVLRHTFCSLLCRAGVDEGVVASILGQADRTMVQQVYRHISEAEKSNAIDKVNLLKGYGL